MDESERQRVLNEEIIEPFAKKGLRTLLYAYKDIDSDYWEELQA
jgi:magnesium-transporting ATPase (P-type)